MFPRIQELTEIAVKFIRNAERLALQMDERGFYVAFSGGKDSQVMLKLVQMAGVKYHAEMQVSTVDPPQLIRFVRKHYPYVKLNMPEMNMRALIVKKKMLPTRSIRFCCDYFKEQVGAGTVTCTGIRREESTQRAKRHPVEVLGQKGKGYEIKDGQLWEDRGGEQLFEMDSEQKVYCVGGKDKVVIAPIFHWTNADVWDFIRAHKMPYCELYDMGFYRIGCVLCPMSNAKDKYREKKQFPNIAKGVYIRAIRELMAEGLFDNFKTPEDVFEWWISSKKSEKYIEDKKVEKIF